MWLIFLVLTSAAAILSQKAFSTPAWFLGAEWGLNVLVVIHATIYLSRAHAWLLAVMVGFLSDVLSQSQLGATSFALLCVTWLLQTQNLTRWRHRWYAQVFLAMVGTLFFLLLDYFSFCIHQGRWLFTMGLLHKMIFSSAINALIAPLAFGILNLLSLLINGKPDESSEESHAA
jgi:rod shape-determining protein MreD